MNFWSARRTAFLAQTATKLYFVAAVNVRRISQRYPLYAGAIPTRLSCLKKRAHAVLIQRND
jgi:hypothetical protein